tara:strand:- start:286 stop:519 length:234 start_codon:yes stop_codon:yes gene_type:complete
MEGVVSSVILFKSKPIDPNPIDKCNVILSEIGLQIEYNNVTNYMGIHMDGSIRDDFAYTITIEKLKEDVNDSQMDLL